MKTDKLEDGKQPDLYLELEALYKKSLFLDAYNNGIGTLGDIRTWKPPRLRLIGARILTQLGLTRAGDAAILRLSRVAPDTEDLPLYWLSVLHRHRGPLHALQRFPEIEKHARGSDKSLANLKMHKSEIFCQYRDFSSAEACLDEIPDAFRDEWYLLHRVDIKFAQDEYHGALKLVDELLELYPDFRAGIQKRARILNILQDIKGAIELLSPVWEAGQSWWAGRQLFHLYLESKNYSEAERCLYRLEGLPPFSDRDAERFHKAMRADLLCVQQKYEEAIPFLEPRSFFYSRVSESIKRSVNNIDKTAARRVLDVPFVRQLHMTCAPASLVAVSRYWGKAADQQQVIEAICYGGTQSFDERDWSNRQGWYTREFELKFDSLKMLIDAEIPVLLATVEPGSAHLQVIVGYDLSMGTYLLRDPYYPRLQECLVEECEKYYAATGPRCLVLVPPEKKDFLGSLALPAAELYDRLFAVNAALKVNDRDLALRHIEEIAALNPEHRLRFECERCLALYDRNEKAILESTEKLLALFPDDINLQLSKAYSLNVLGSTAESRKYLEQLAARENSHFLIKSRLVDAIRWDHREIGRTDKLYRELLKISPLHAATLFGYAGVLWDKSEFRESYQLYRFATCLEDVNESYAESYFKAAQFHKDTEHAIEFLKDRFTRFGRKSCGPAISLFNALDSLDRQKEGMGFLKQAINLRPEDGHLLLFCARKLLYLGQSEKSLKLLQRAKSHVNEIRFHETAAEIHEFQADHKQALDALAKVIDKEPLNYNANASTMRLLTEEGKRDEALNHVRKQLEFFPGNSMLQRLEIEWLDNSELGTLAECYRNYINDHPDDTWAYRGLSSTYSQLGRHDLALAAAREAVTISPSECSNWGVLGNALLTLNNRKESREAFRQAIRLSCDYSYAYEKLLESSLDIQAQREDLDFIYRELMQQVSYGEGILEFQNLAMRWSSIDKIGEFLVHALDVRPDLWQSWVALAIHHRNTGGIEESLRLLDEAIEKFPLLPRLFLEKAESLRLLYRDDEAIEALEHTLELSPEWTLASNRLCELLEKKGRLDEAVKLQRFIIKRTPLSPTPHVYLADLLERLGQLDDAINHAERAVDLAPSYQWAWQLLFRLKAKIDRSGEVLEKLQQAMNTWPENSVLLEIYSELEKDNKKVIDLLTNFLQSHPRHLDACIKLVRSQVQEGEYDQALHFCGAAYWGEERPLSIRANEAWVHARRGDLKRAIEMMENITRENENYYDSWRLLANWYESINDNHNTIRAVQHCARLYPNDPEVLCYCAEKLQLANGDESRIADMLRHAFELNVTDQHIALTYIDYVLKRDNVDAADSALEILSRHRNNPYVALRQLELALLRKNHDKALEVFSSILIDPDREHGMVPFAWKAMQNQQQQKPAAELIRKLIDVREDVHPDAGKCLAQFEARKKIKDVEKKLLSMAFNNPLDLRYLEGYIRHLSEANKSFPARITTGLWEKFKLDTLNWGLAAYVIFNHDSVTKAKSLISGIENRQDVAAWMLYFQSISLRWVNQWKKAAELIQQARNLPADNYQHDISVWHVVDSLFQNLECDPAPLEYLRDNDLAPISQYGLAVSRALLALGNSNFVEAYSSVSPLLRECQKKFQGQSDNPVVRTLKQQTKLRFRKSIPPMNFARRLFWTWRLSNHF